VLTYAYHPTTGNLSSIAAPGSTLSYTYDGSLLTQSTWSGTVSGSVGRTYDNNFRITSQSVNGANTVTFGYDTDSLLTSAGTLSLSRSAQHGLITGTTLATVTDSRSYNTFGELSSYTANVSGSPVLSVTYNRDKLGRITQKVETIGGVTDTFEYGYDLAGRVTQVRQNGAVVASYLYDTNGNRLSKVTPSGTTSGTYDAQDRLTQYGSTTYGYTANGELQSSTVGGQTTTYTYDVLGNLKSVVGPTGFTIEYVVDGQNRRIGKKVNGTLAQGWLWEGALRPVAELDGTGAINSVFVYGTKTNVPEYIIKGAATYRIVTDHLGSVRLVINVGDGSIVQRIDYDEFGNVLQDTAPGFQPFGFAGGLYDQHTGLTRFGARDYDAVTGRWTAKDPIDFDGPDTNLYTYVGSDPINFTDPLGLQTWPGAGPVTSAFGNRTHPTTGEPDFHNGVDIENLVGGDVLASDSGVVISTTPSPSGANQILVQNNDGSVSGYAHVHPSVQVGQAVKEGDPIGRTDLSGRSTGGHVHYTWRPGGQNTPPQNPLNHLPTQNNYRKPPQNPSQKPC
jgi:RHS repeat-associated protein